MVSLGGGPGKHNLRVWEQVREGKEDSIGLRMEEFMPRAAEAQSSWGPLGHGLRA